MLNMELKKWNYKGFEIEESLKPGAKRFQYFFRIEEEGTKKCTFCVWMTDDIVNTKSSKESITDKFEEIIMSDRESWIKWVKEKIDKGIFNDLAIKISISGEEEIKLSEISERVDF